MAPGWLVSHLVISSKWLPKIFIKIFKEYLRAKLQAPVVTTYVFVEKYEKLSLNYLQYHILFGALVLQYLSHVLHSYACTDSGL